MAGRAPLLIANVLAASGYERLVKMATASAGDDGPRLAATVVGGLGGFQLGDAMDALAGVVRGEGTLDAWVEQYGFRGPVEYELAASPWGDDEAHLEAMLEQARGRADDENEAAKRARAHDEAARARAELRRRVGPVRAPMLAFMLRDLETHTRWRENAKVHEVLEVAVVRLAAREAGRRLAAAGNDRRARRRLLPPRPRARPRAGHRLGRAVARHGRSAGARSAPGNSASSCPSCSSPSRARSRWCPTSGSARSACCRARRRRGDSGAGGDDDDTAAGDDGVLRGVGVSAGTVTAAVRIVTDPYDAAIEPGEVLVAHTTDPAWTPLFLQAAGVVIDYGGPLSHGAVISRELGIPCVINVKDATTRLTTGRVVTVDGTAGEVRPD